MATRIMPRREVIYLLIPVHEIHEALVVIVMMSSLWSICWKLEIVWSKTVSLCIRIRKYPSLEKLVIRIVDARDNNGGGKNELLLACTIMDSLAPPRPQGTTATGAAELVRAYRVWEGSNIFCLGGRLIFGPDARSIFITISLIVAPAVVFGIWIARELMNDFSNHRGIAIMVVFVVLTVYVLVALLLTSGRDPGIVPRNAQPPEPEDQSHLWSRRVPRIPPTKDVIINGVTVKIKYCDTCKLYRPPRCSHCSICDNCVEGFDHHCPWVGQCIGLRNYRFFFMFIFSATLLCLYVHAFCWVLIVRTRHSGTIWSAMIKSPATIVLIIYTFLALWFVGGLSVFHLYLISTNQTTYENFRYRYSRNASPYNKGIARNFLEKFCTRIPPSKNNFRAKVPRAPLMHSLSQGSSLVSSTFLMNSRREQEQEHEQELGKSNRVSLESDEDDGLPHKWQEKPLVS